MKFFISRDYDKKLQTTFFFSFKKLAHEVICFGWVISDISFFFSFYFIAPVVSVIVVSLFRRSTNNNGIIIYTPINTHNEHCSCG